MSCTVYENSAVAGQVRVCELLSKFRSCIADMAHWTRCQAKQGVGDFWIRVIAVMHVPERVLRGNGIIWDGKAGKNGVEVFMGPGPARVIRRGHRE